jgi:hypothetical protein
MTAITAPFQLEALETVKNTHRQEFYADVTTASGTVRLNVSDAEITFSEDYSPRLQGSVTCANTLDAAGLAEFDPRHDLPVQLYAGYVRPGSAPDVQLVATALASHRGCQQPGDSLELIIAGGEVRAHEVKWLQADQVKSFNGVLEAVQWLVGYACYPASAVVKATVPLIYRSDLVSAVSLETGTAIWDIAYSLAASAGLSLYVDSEGAWRLEPPASKYGETAAYLTLGPSTPVTNMEDVLSRDGYYEDAVIKYAWKDVTGDKSMLGIWAPAAGALGVGAGCKTFVTERPGPITQSAANTAARLAIKELSTRGASYEVTATAHYWLRPGMSVQLTTAAGDYVRHIAKTVKFNFGAGTMTVATREPSNLGEF